MATGTKKLQVIGLKGSDGFSPTIEVIEIDGGHRLTITDINGTQSVNVMNGSGEQDGSGESTYVLPVANADTLGGVKPVVKTEAMTQKIGVDEVGQLWTEPTAGSGGETTTHTITQTLTNVVSSNISASVLEGGSFVTVLSAETGYTLGTPAITMGGVDITATAWNADTATITIASVTGDVAIICAGVEQTGPVDTSPVIIQESAGYTTTAQIQINQPATSITKIYEYQYDKEELKANPKYDETNNYITMAGVMGSFVYYTPSLAHAASGGIVSGLTPTTKIIYVADGVQIANASNQSYVNSVEATHNIARHITPLIDSEKVGFGFTLFTADIDDSYAYWSERVTEAVLPIGIRSGDIIFAGKNTPYYGMANIDGTMAGSGATAQTLSFDDDLAQDYNVATTSILGNKIATDTQTAYGLSTEFATLLDNTKKAWMTEYGGDYRKIPLIITADQHGRRSDGLFKMLGATVNMHDVSKICNLGDTVSNQWVDKDTSNPLLECGQLESWMESIKPIPFSKRLDVFGNHDTWYGNYEDEGNSIGTRYPPSQAHLDQYFRNVYARRTNNNGWFVVKDDRWNIKYVVISAFEYARSVSFRIGTAQMDFIIDEFSKDDGYDIVIISHVPLLADPNNWSLPTTPDQTTSPSLYRVSALDTDAFFAARRAKTSGTIVDSDGVSHSYDFSGCTTKLLCSLHGHTHYDMYTYVGDFPCVAFDWFDDTTVHFVLVDRANNQINVWKVDSTMTEAVNYQIPLDKPAE